jgi:hypothetical protein
MPPKASDYGSDEHLVMDAQGAPLVVYHGVKNPDMRIEGDKVIFTPKFKTFDTTGRTEPGVWFSPDPKVAGHYGTPVPFYIKAKNPIRCESPLEQVPPGHDAVYRMRGKGDNLLEAWEIGVFSSAQIVWVNEVKELSVIKTEDEAIGVESLLEATGQMFDDYGSSWFRHRGADRAVDLEAREGHYHVKLFEERTDDSVFGKSLYEVATASFPRSTGKAETLDRLKLFATATIGEIIGQAVVPLVNSGGSSQAPSEMERQGQDQSPAI